ncbi:MAG TPA: nitrate- and nitrite sensing domain-containing protein [Pseudonocardiaceae bacterium]|nr:nitrate- and nitrite sensing domain-containing protein [Pseudonocardiaceae bacterium]
MLSAILRPRSIRARLVRILVVSLALVLVLLGFLITNETANYRAATQTSRIVTVVLRVQDAAQQLQKERALTNGLLGGGSQFQAQITPQRQQTDQALAALNRTISGTGFSDAGAAQVRTALAKLDGLTTIRSDVDQERAQDAPTFSFYTDAIASLNALDLGLDQAQDGALRHGLQALYALGDIKEYAGQEQGLLSAVFAGNRMSVDNYAKFVEVLGQKQAAVAQYDQFATPAERAELDATLQSPAGDQSVQDEGVAINSSAGALPAKVDPVSWSDSMNSLLDSLRGVQQSVGQDITSRADSLRATATALLVGISVLAVLTIAAMIALVVGAARSVIGPLGTLARDADVVSARRLPETVALMQTTETEVPPPPPVTVPAHAASEIQLVATALDRVQNTALTLASEQALIRRNTTASLANLGRRNQNLVRRQLSLISEFEREELDPNALANMFELDHLATRMRRNAESLLVLVGETSPRPWSAPLPVADVIRAALSEVEEYRRVVLRRVDEAWVVGPVVAEIAHMLAELVENGLSFSSPDVEVEIYGRRTGNRYLLAVVDYGVGMPKEELQRAQARLRDEENFLVAPTRFLGHYVVGRLARQLEVQVELGESPVSGITARMVLPGELLTEGPGADPSRVVAQPAPAEPRAHALPAPEPTPVLAAPAAGVRPVDTMVDTVRLPIPESVPSQPVLRWPTEQELLSQAEPDTRPAAVTLAEPEPPPVPVTVGGPIERTRNGLVKRQPRSGGRSSPTRYTVTDAAPKDRTPNEVGDMLNAFRSGHRRGERSARNLFTPREEDPGD